MDKNSFRVGGPSAQRRPFTAVPEDGSWNPPQRRMFSSREQRSNCQNAEALADCVDGMDDPPVYLRDDSKMPRPFSNPRFGAPRDASEEGPDIKIAEQKSVENSQGDSDSSNSLEERLSDASGSHGNDRIDAETASQICPSFSPLQSVLDSVWEWSHGFSRAPEQLQEGFDDMKDELHKQISKLSTEKQRSERFSRDAEALRRELKAFQDKEKQYELQVSKQEEALKVQSAKSDSLRGEIEKLRSESRKKQLSFKKTEDDMNRELDIFSKDLEATKKDLLLKEKAYGQVQREGNLLKQKHEDEVKRRESVQAESQVFQRDLVKLRKRSNEEKQRWTASQEEIEAQRMELEKRNKTLTARVTTLEGAVENQQRSNQIVETELLSVLSFLRRRCFAVQKAYQASCVHSCPGSSEVISLPRSTCSRDDDRYEDCEVFGKLFEALNASLSANSVLELASAYKEAFMGFFKTLVLRDVETLQFVCSSGDALERIESTHVQRRHSFREEFHSLRALSEELWSQLPVLQQKTCKIIEVFERKVTQIEEEKMKMREDLINLEGISVTIKDKLDTCKEYLTSEKENLLKLKKQVQADFQDFKNRLSQDADEKASLREEVEKAEMTIKELDFAASARAKKQKDAEASLREEIERLRNLLIQRDVQLKELSRSEANLRKAKEELVCSSRQAITDVEECKRGMTALMREKDDALKMLGETKHALHQMSEKFAEALGAKQTALQALIREKGTTEELRSTLAKVSASSRQPQEVQEIPTHALLKAEPNMLHDDEHDQGRAHMTDVERLGGSVRESISHKRPNENPRSSPTSKHASSKERENTEADTCKVDLVPKRTKRRQSSQKPRKIQRQKRFRQGITKAATTATSTQDHIPNLDSKELLQPQDDKAQASSTSAASRDAEWDIDVVIGNKEY